VVSPHRFLGINPSGQVSVIKTRGNSNAHLVLRGGSDGPNFDAGSIATCESALAAEGLPSAIMVDCNHANSSKDHNRQPLVAKDVVNQIRSGNQSIVGLMLESHLHAGRQNLGGGDLEYGISITDACIDWESTESLLRELNEALSVALAQRAAA